MASKYEKNTWELYDPMIPVEDQPHSFITKRKLEKMEDGIESANIELEVGDIQMGESASVTIVGDIKNKTKKLNITFPPAGRGADGKSAYESWLDAGNIGTEQEFLDYLKGIDGKDGINGKDGKDGARGPAGESAYQTWIAAGNMGSMQDFLDSLIGAVGPAGTPGAIGPTGPQGPQGERGESAYEIWKSQPGNENKTITEFLESLKGEKGDPGEGDEDGAFVDFY